MKNSPTTTMEFNREGIDFKDVKIGDRIERLRPDIFVHNRRSGGQNLNFLVISITTRSAPRAPGWRSHELQRRRKNIGSLGEMAGGV